MRIESKQQLIDANDEQWRLLWELVDSLTPEQLLAPLSASDENRSGKDVLAHLYAWHGLVLKWIRDGRDGGSVDLPAAGFNWRQTPQLNRQLHERHADLSLDSVKRRLKRSHNRLARLVEETSEEQLLETGHFAWTGKLSLAKYIAPNMVSHYRWAARKLKSIASAD